MKDFHGNGLRHLDIRSSAVTGVLTWRAAAAHLRCPLTALLFLLLCAWIIPAQASAPPRAELMPYTTTPEATASNRFLVSVNDEPIFVEKAGDVSYARFAFTGTANISISITSGSISSASVSPLSYGYDASKTIESSTLSFTVRQPRTLIVRINDLENLLIFADGPEVDAPDPAQTPLANVSDYLRHPDPYEGSKTLNYAFDAALSALGSKGGVLYVPDGLYILSQLKLPDNIHLYLEDGALLRAIDASTEEQFAQYYPPQNGRDSSFIYVTGDSVKISGRGVIDGNGFNLRDFDDSGAYNLKLIRVKGTTDDPLSGFTMDDVYLRNSARWTVHLIATRNVTIKRVKIINDMTVVPGADDRENRPYVSNTDGFDTDGSSDVLIDGCFIYTVDDAFSPKVTGYFGYTELASTRQTFVNNVIYTQKSALKVGNELLNNISDIFFGNNDIVISDRFFSLWTEDGVYGTYSISNVVFNNNRAEEIGWPDEQRRFFYFQIKTEASPPRPGRITNVYVNGLFALKDADSGSKTQSYDQSHNVSNFDLKNMYVAEVPIDSLSDLRFSYTNPYHVNLAVTAPGASSKEVNNGDSSSDSNNTANTVQVAASPPLVEVFPADDWAQEGSDTGAFTFSRSGPLGEALTVYYALGGSAEAGIDYVTGAGSITFEPNQQQTSLTLLPFPDNASEDTEVATLTLLGNANYVFDTASADAARSPNTATITIADGDPRSGPPCPQCP